MLLRIDEFIFCLKWPWSLISIIGFMALLGLIAFKTKHLTWDGSLAAAVTGSVVMWCTRTSGFTVLLFFYCSCYIVAFLAKLNGAGENKIEKKGSKRDSMQVCANAIGCLISALIYYNTQKDFALVMFGCALSEATSDTWAGEIGRLSQIPPMSIRTFKPVEKGTSGGITVLGLVGSLAGSALLACFWQWVCNGTVVGTLIIILCGFLGCILDSFLGATIQAMYIDSRTGLLTEHEFDQAGNPQQLARGFKWMDNDMVNLLSNITATLLGFVLTRLN